jgi:hypothetical protein
MLFLLAFMLLLGLSKAEKVSIVERNTPDIKTRLICAQFTDFYPRKVALYAVDYFRIPTNLTTTSNLSTALFTFATLRSRNDRDPESLTLVLFYGEPNVTIDMPAATPFFTKRVSAPGEPPTWQNVSMTDITNIQVNISNGEKSEHDPSVIFDLANASLLPRDTLLWVGFYMSGTRNHSTVTGSDNCLYWVVNHQQEMNINESGTFFYYLDTGVAVSQQTIVYWNNASTVVSKLRVNTSSRQMAWTLYFQSDSSPSYLDYLKRMGTKEMVIIVFASLASFIVLCVCGCWCFRKCRLVSMRRRERARQGSNASRGKKTVENLNTSYYSPVYTTKDSAPLEMWSTDEVSLDASQHATQFDDIPTMTIPSTAKKYTPAGRFINTLQKETKFI